MIEEEKKPSSVKIEAFLYITRSGGIRATKNRCAIKEGEIRTRVMLEIPPRLFDQDMADIRVVIPEEAKRAIIDAESSEAAGSW